MTAGLALRAALALAGVLLLVLLSARAARARLAHHAPEPGALRLRATLAIDPRRRLHLVETPLGPVLILAGGATDIVLPPAGTAP